jgi:hypothetical protein
MNGALLPAATMNTMTTTTMTAATTTATMTAATMAAVMTTTSAGTLLPTATTGVARHDATPAFPTTMAPGLLQAQVGPHVGGFFTSSCDNFLN